MFFNFRKKEKLAEEARKQEQQRLQDEYHAACDENKRIFCNTICHMVQSLPKKRQIVVVQRKNIFKDDRERNWCYLKLAEEMHRQYRNSGKNMKKALTIIGIIVLVIISIVLVIFNTLNKEKTPISASTFNTTMEGKGYVLTDTTSLFTQYQNYMLESYVAQKTGYQIEFYELSTEENAISMYNTNKSKFESQKTNVSVSSTVNLSNFSTYSLTTNGKYKYLSRIDNILVYVDVDEIYKDAIKDIIKEIGY